MSGKGDTQRPTDDKAYSEGYDRIFRKPDKERDRKDADPE